MSKIIRKWNRWIHRDLGYFFAGMIIIYGLSGIALNHIDDWDPSYTLINETIEVETMPSGTELNLSQIKEKMKEWKIRKTPIKHYYPDENTMKVFFKGGNFEYQMVNGIIIMEGTKRRPIFHAVNWLHYNPNNVWKWYSDFFAGALILLSVSGLFILRGKQGLKGRGKWLLGVGILLPLTFLLVFYF